MIKLLFLDVDGCLTDGGIIYNSDGGFIKKFNVIDGAAIEAWLKLGNHLAIITGRVCPCVESRAKALKISMLRQGVKDKLSCANELLKEAGVSLDESAAIGDYYNDQALLSAVKCSFKPANGARDLKVDVSLSKSGGKGAVAEMIEYLVEKNGQKQAWDELWG